MKSLRKTNLAIPTALAAIIFSLTGTIGQPDALTASSGGNFKVSGGFWAADSSAGVRKFYHYRATLRD